RGGRRNRVVLVPRRWDQARERLRVTVANKPGAPRRARISRNTIAQGRPVVPAEPEVTWWAFVCGRPLHTTLRARAAPRLPCALRFRRGDDFPELGPNMLREQCRLSSDFPSWGDDPAGDNDGGSRLFLPGGRELRAKKPPLIGLPGFVMAETDIPDR